MKKTQGTQQDNRDNATRDQASLERQITDMEDSVKDYQFFLIRLAIFAAAVWVIFFVFIGTTHMPSGDMVPNLASGDLVIFYRLDKNVASQDVIVFEKNVPEMGGKTVFVSRVVAVAGDTVEITDEGRLMVNGNLVVEPKVYSYETTRYEGYTEYPLTLQEDECFVLADHREGGSDSRFFGPVHKDEIDGTVITMIRKNLI